MAEKKSGNKMPPEGGAEASMDYTPPYGDPAALNLDGLIRTAVGEKLLKEVVYDVLELMGTSSAVYEKNGDYALGIFSSGWCQCLDNASYELCETDNLKEAIESGEWLCHESCWSDCSKRCIEENRPVEVECNGGLMLYAVPIVVNGEPIGAINFGHGGPPASEQALEELAAKYKVDRDLLEEMRRNSLPQTEARVLIAKRRLQRSALLIGKIVESYLSEQKLRESEALLDYVGVMARVGGWSIDVASGKLNWSDETYRIHEIPIGTEPPLDEAINYYHPDDRPALTRAVERALEFGEPYDMELRFITAKGRHLWVHIKCSPRVENGKVTFLLGTFQDITERKERETDLKEARAQAEQEEAKLHAVLDRINTGITVYDTSINQVYANDAQAQIHGFKNAEEARVSWAYIEKNFVVQTYPGHEDLKTDEWPVIRVLAGESVSGETLLIYRRDITRARVVVVSGAPIRNARGEVILAVMATHDITEDVQREERERVMQEKLEQTQRLESLGVLAGGIAHDFNNLLMAIVGNADLALMELSSVSPVANHIVDIKKASRRAADLCTQLLAYSGKGKLEEKPFSMSELVEEMLHMLKSCISKKCVLNLNLEDDLPVTQGDPSQMRQIIMNFVINASEAIGDRSGVISVSTGAMDCSREYLESGYVLKPAEAGLYITLEVSDNGEGMDKETLDRVFEPFYTTKFSGRGLGLSATLGIIRSHGGGLRVYSEPGEGTTFKVLLPADKEDAQCERLKRAEDAAGKQWRGRGTVLLVDDEETVRAISGQQLEFLGLHVLTAVDGRDAVALYREKQDEIDLVILDLTMPRMGGEEAFRELRTLDPSVKVLIASGYSRSDVVPRFFGKEIAGFLRKPYTIEDLAAVLSETLPARS